jgi:cytochrome c peroxidase
MRRNLLLTIGFASFAILFFACEKDHPTQNIGDVYVDSPYNYQVPNGFPQMQSPSNNPLTKRGVELGRMLFYDPILSSDSSISCASCHKPEFGFSDNNQFSIGVDGAIGDIQAMPLINMAWQTRFFWNGRAHSLEEQAIGPITNPIEMHETPLNVITKLKSHPVYPKYFRTVFNSNDITIDMVQKALSQFERIIVSSDSKIDEFLVVGPSAFTDALEFEGFNIFMTERGQCFHCHGANGTLIAHNLDTLFRNNGLLNDAQLPGAGLSAISGKASDDGKFKVTTLRNIELTAPYMHNGKFKTLEEVVEFYSSGINQNRNLDINFTKNPERLDQFGGLGFTPREKQALVKFLKTMTDTSLANKPELRNPFN